VGRLQAVEPDAAAGNVDHLAPDQLTGLGLLGVVEVVVVPAEGVVAAVDRLDPVEYHLSEVAAVIGNDLTLVIGGLLGHDHQVSGGDPRRHAVPVGLDHGHAALQNRDGTDNHDDQDDAGDRCSELAHDVRPSSGERR
jgi:hypothetical protein